ncbi:conserved hypothetical protein [Vibrio nigripulchritudo MADA3029]|uniref:hypothetical protein n=1 Tax=Vibrio nigripulchritudo TaxID=28173 RepID=UPI0003B2144E|nr:hypothetical protein [Vibrio nigripulchritudo]CCN48862.1 conserved hypothetical protein [Vibrio nigripulchritudo MADA3020]CCN51454.1 conserved hypothetical protein [Vibrio nigripulchritudo MADA3021]CCN57636.1 conserved hypothetical protein [Vibrio nigripulchritudo MADA3029]
MEDKIKSWLDKTGYPLELYVQKELMKHGYLCDKSPLYVDFQESVSREIDVVAIKPTENIIPCSFETNLFIECKKSDKPLVVLTADTDKSARFSTLFGHEIVKTNYPSFGVTALANLLDSDTSTIHEIVGGFSSQTFVGYSIVTSFSKSDENIYKGIMGLAKASDYFRGKYLDYFKHLMKEKARNPYEEFHYELHIPTLVVDCPLFVAYLDKKGEMQVESVEWSNIRIKLPWVVGNYDEERECSIQVVTKKYFAQFLLEVDKISSYVSSPKIMSQSVEFNT